MTADDFADFYRGVHGAEFSPFPWQVRLARRVAEQGWPAVLALPTAAGKTSAIDIAVFALALQAGKPLRDRTAPLRIFFVIDRRLVVDQAANHARRLQHALDNPGGNRLVREVAEALCLFGGIRPLHLATLRGAMYRDDSWVKAPIQPTVCVSTVDQVGSRLLFRGYGVSPYAQPVHAALTGNDALYLLDEAHLSQPFLETLQNVQRYRLAPWAERFLGGPFDVVEVSATPQTQGERFGLTEEDHLNPELSRRLSACKPAHLAEPVRFEVEAAEQAIRAQAGDVKVVGIIVNRVASARDIFSRLPGEPFEDKVLLTGRIRAWDRDALLGSCLGRLRAGRSRSDANRPLFVVATMTVEVGADLDFDFLVTEAATLPALRQRFGRLDRLGRFGQGAGIVLLRKARGPDPIYGEELAQTWGWLRRQAEATDGVIDFGINALDTLIRNAKEPPPKTASRPAPVLFPAHLDAWVQTSPAPEPTPDVAPFLHGADALEAADVQVVWRADLIPGQEEDWLETVGIAPPSSRESLPVPLAAVREWLREEAPAEVADIEGTATPARPRGAGKPGLRWWGPDSENSRVVEPDELRPGDTLVVPSSYGGADAFGWSPLSNEKVPDVSDLCVNDMANAAPGQGKRLIRLRFHDQRTPVREVRERLEQAEETDSVVQQLLESVTDCPLLQAVAGQLARTSPKVTPYPAGIVVTARVRPGFFRADGQPLEAEDDNTDVDDTSSLRAGTQPPTAVTLEDHAEGVVRWARAFASQLGFDDDLLGVLGQAAHLHDIGKADWRFQFMLYGDEPQEPVLAKSGRDWDAAEQAKVRNRARLPNGFRHEFVSVALVCNHTDLLLEGLTEHQRRLVEYLIGTHHGRGRPFVPFIEENEPEQVLLPWNGQTLSASADHRLWRLDSRWTDRFWGLVRCYGYWGLAYLEAILRLADGACSAEEQERGRKDG